MTVKVQLLDILLNVLIFLYRPRIKNSKLSIAGIILLCIITLSYKVRNLLHIKMFETCN